MPRWRSPSGSLSVRRGRTLSRTGIVGLPGARPSGHRVSALRHLNRRDGRTSTTPRSAPSSPTRLPAVSCTGAVRGGVAQLTLHRNPGARVESVDWATIPSAWRKWLQFGGPVRVFIIPLSKLINSAPDGQWAAPAQRIITAAARVLAGRIETSLIAADPSHFRVALQSRACCCLPRWRGVPARLSSTLIDKAAETVPTGRLFGWAARSASPSPLSFAASTWRHNDCSAMVQLRTTVYQLAVAASAAAGSSTTRPVGPFVRSLRRIRPIHGRVLLCHWWSP